LLVIFKLAKYPIGEFKLALLFLLNSINLSLRVISELPRVVKAFMIGVAPVGFSISLMSPISTILFVEFVVNPPREDVLT
jgi:hypothetical protein